MRVYFIKRIFIKLVYHLNILAVNLKTNYLIICLPISAASLVNDYLPEPPTPTNNADDLGCLIIREILIK